MATLDKWLSDETITCPKCGSKHLIKGGIRLNRPRGGSPQPIPIQMYTCKDCQKHFSIRAFRYTQFSDANVKMILKLMEHVEEDIPLQRLLFDVHGIKVSRHTLANWRMAYSPSYKPKHRWSKEIVDGKVKCIRCGLRATPQELKNVKIPPPYCLNPITQREKCLDLQKAEILGVFNGRKI